MSTTYEMECKSKLQEYSMKAHIDFDVHTLSTAMLTHEPWILDAGLLELRETSVYYFYWMCHTYRHYTRHTVSPSKNEMAHLKSVTGSKDARLGTIGMNFKSWISTKCSYSRCQHVKTTQFILLSFHPLQIIMLKEPLAQQWKNTPSSEGLWGTIPCRLINPRSAPWYY